MNRNTVRQLTVFLGVVATLVVNGLANALPLNGQMTGEISDRFRVYFVPAGYVFAIWGLIYLGLVAYAVYQALPAQRENPRLVKIGYWFVLSCVANIAWIFLWHYNQFPPNLLAMLSLLGLLLAIYLALGIGKRQVSPGERWLVHLPFSVYLGWITVATIANVTDVLDYVKWSGWGLEPQVWAVIMLLVGLAVGFLMALRHGDVAYNLVLVWAFAGIGVSQAATPLVANAAWVVTVLTVVLLAVGLVLYRRKPALAA
jgi:benzodiazapine receptor